MNKECASRLLMWRNASRSFSVEDAAYEPVLGALSINATMCEPMALFAPCCSGVKARSLFWYRPLVYLLVRHTSTGLVFGIGLAR